MQGDGVVRQEGVAAAELIDDLGDAQVDGDASEGKGVEARDGELRGRRSSIWSSAIWPAASRSGANPKVSQPAGVSARGAASGMSSCSAKVRVTSSIGHSMAVRLTSPSPWAAWPSPTENSAPGTAMGR
jgi:hypothetical protein